MDKKDIPGKSQEGDKALKAFLVHLIIFVIVNLCLLFVPVLYDDTVDFSFESRGPLLYGSVGWAVGLTIHGIIVFYDRFVGRSTSKKEEK